MTCNYLDPLLNYPDDFIGLFQLDPKNPSDIYGKKELDNFDKKTPFFLFMVDKMVLLVKIHLLIV